MNAIALSQNIVNIQSELNLIGANARSLKGPGRDLLPLKIEMLGAFHPDEQAAIMETVELLFAAVLQFVDARLAEGRSRNAVDVATARIERGQADGVIIALTHGRTRELLRAAYEVAPIAMHTIAHVAPRLAIEERLAEGLAKAKKAQEKRLRHMRDIST